MTEAIPLLVAARWEPQSGLDLLDLLGGVNLNIQAVGGDLHAELGRSISSSLPDVLVNSSAKTAAEARTNAPPCVLPA